VAAADAVFIAVGTPSRRGDGHADLSYVYSAAREIATALDSFTVVITKSTVPVGTGDEVARILREARPDADVAVVSNPEFLREGAAIQDLKHPDRIVVGADDERARKLMLKSIGHSTSTRRRSSTPAVAAPSVSSMQPTRSWRQKLPLSTRWPIWQKKSGRTCRTSPAALGSTTGSDQNFCMPAQVLAAHVFRRTHGRCSRLLKIGRYPCASSRQLLLRTIFASAPWHEKYQPRSEGR
jgi:UDP-glucose/GDP-mannose dehydrogenase family, NAD binding domain